MPRDVRARGHGASSVSTKAEKLGWLTRVWAEPAYRFLLRP